MDEREIRSVLQDALEEEIPPSQINLWPAVQASLVSGNQQRVQQGEKMKLKRLYRVPRLAFVFSMIVALLAVAALTPQGRVLSESILQFFKRAESSVFPLQPSQIVTSDPDPSAPTAMPPAPLISVDEAEAVVGFEIAELPFVPEGFNYLGARLYGDAVSIEYETQGKGGHLHLMQSQEGFIQSDWDKVPAHAVVPVQIGNVSGEFTRGTFVVYTGETVARWEPKAPILRLRWVQDGIWFQMTKTGNVEEIEYLGQAGLIELAESLVIKP